ncbi:hypothetical protein [Diaminobutyricimonas sp. LJ205]|uniref:hypothetical protein n=1 Tax=Diaminobutyricimonas sp. LJ205 TaxID=2683590 RepID=UPI0012F4DEE4|nr:hypothetical protein [Diaminobutyricimonas sp. LJ205]
MSTTKPDLVIGGAPKADLLPPSIREARKFRGVARLLVAAVIVVALVVAAGVGLAFVRAMSSQADLLAEQERTTALLLEQQKYAEARDAARQVDGAKIAMMLGTTTEIDWKASLDEINATLPAGLTLTSVVFDALAPGEAVPVVEMPLQEDWVATLTLTAASPTVPDVESWLNNLVSITGFAGVAPPVTVTGDADQGYVAAVKINLSDEAYLLRFQAGQED